MSLLDVVHQVVGVLRKRNGGTGNPYGWGSAVVFVGQNATTDPLPVGTVVKFIRVLESVAPAEAGDAVAGVVVGTYLHGDGTTLVEAAAPAAGTVAVMALGPCRILIASDVSARQYARVSATDGKAETAPDADGVFAQFMSNGDESVRNLVSAFVFTAAATPVPEPPPDPPTLGECEAAFHLPSVGQLTRWSRVPYDLTITGWTIVADTSDDITIDVWGDAYSSAPPMTDGTSIAGSALPELSGAQRATSSTLTGWTTTLNEGDWIRFQVADGSPTAFTDVVLALHVTKTL